MVKYKYIFIRTKKEKYVGTIMKYDILANARADVNRAEQKGFKCSKIAKTSKIK